MKKKIAYIFMILGILLIVAALAIFIYNNYENKKAKEYSAMIMERIHSMEGEKLPSDPFDEEMVVVEIDGYGYIGYLSLPTLDLELPVMAEWDYPRLKISPCRYYGSTKTDNLVIAAHNFRYHFGYIGKLREGDIVTFTDMEFNVHTYMVNSIETLAPTDVAKVKDTGDDLILYTCTYGGSKRIAVMCSYVENENK